MTARLIIYADTYRQAETWFKSNCVYHNLRPIFAAPESSTIFRGLRDSIIIMIGNPPIVPELHFCADRNTILSLERNGIIS